MLVKYTGLAFPFRIQCQGVVNILGTLNVPKNFVLFAPLCYTTPKSFHPRRTSPTIFIY